MNRTASPTLAVVLVLALVAVPLGAASVVSTNGVQDDPQTGGNESITPGEQLAAGVGVQAVEIEEEVSNRALATKISNADTSEAKAAVLSDQYGESQTHLNQTNESLNAVTQANQGGELSEGHYRVQVAKLVSELRAIERQVATAEAVATELPQDAFDERGVDADSISALHDRASEIRGSDRAEAAREFGNIQTRGGFTGNNTPGGPPADVPGHNQTSEVPTDVPEHNQTPDRGGDQTDRQAESPGQS